MKKIVSKLLAVALALAVSGCGLPNDTKTAEQAKNEPKQEQSTEQQTKTAEQKPVENGTEEIKDLVISKVATRELETFNIVNTQMAAGFENLCNLVDGLLEVDSYGALAPAIAKEWGTQDGGLTWTFKLRENVQWVDVKGNIKAQCVADDFATGLEWVLNFHKNASANTSMPIEMIKGAGEYYEYTKSLSEEEGFKLTAAQGSKFREMVGIETPDELTVVYHCIDPKPYFDTVATYACLYPIAQGMQDELGVKGVQSMNNENMWYNGAYTMTNYVQGNEKTFTKNPLYWDKDCKLFDTVTIKMVESNDVAFQLYQTGEIDYVDLTESNLKTISGNKDHPFNAYLVEKPADKYSYQLHFNYDKYLENGEPDINWNTAIANEAFRRSIYYGLDVSNYYTRVNALNPMACENNFYTMKGLIYTSDGKDYTRLVAEKMGLPPLNGKTMARLDKEKAARYREQATAELTALGVTFPVEMDYYIAAANQVALDSANVLKQTFENSFGKDFIKMNIKTYVSSSTKEVYDPHLHSITTNGWGADYGDPMNYLVQETYGNDNAYYSRAQSKINDVEETPATKQLLDTYKEFTELVEKADAVNKNMDERYDAFAEAEAYMLEHALVIPMYYNVPWCLTKIDQYSKMNAMFGCQNEKMKNWNTSSAGYTTEEMDEIAKNHKK